MFKAVFIYKKAWLKADMQENKYSDMETHSNFAYISYLQIFEVINAIITESNSDLK